MSKIRRLDPVTSSQIAAGEVVERPASVVKELVENSMDAGASRILVGFRDSGLEIIKVSDDGSGMAPEDAEMAVERFATSKLSSILDLDAMETLGFRGEALPSIAACSRLTLETREESQPYGTEVTVEGGKVISVKEKGLPVGTTVFVRDLFYNTPARLKFMKTRSRERQAIIGVLESLALARPDKSIEVRDKDKTVMRTSGQGLKNAIADLFGPDMMSSMTQVSFTSGGEEPVQVSGMVGLPGLYRRSRDRQVFSVNFRVVKNSMLSWALDDAYRGLIPPKSYPVAFLQIVTAGRFVDVNVHPTKDEVRFQNDREVRHAVVAAVSAALSSSGFQVQEKDPYGIGGEQSPGAPHQWARDIGRKKVEDSPFYHQVSLANALNREQTEGPRHLISSDLPSDSGWEYLGSLHDTYLVAKTLNSLILVDKHALMESLAYRELIDRKSGSQDLLMAEVVRLSPKEAAIYEDFEKTLNESGFGARLVGETTVLVTKVPLVMGVPVAPSGIKDILENLSDGARHRAQPERLIEAARIALASCHASIRAREYLSAEEAKALLAKLYREPAAAYCPHGRPTVKEIPVFEMDRFFGRTSHKDSGRV